MVIKFNSSKDEQGYPRRSARVNAALATIIILLVCLVAVSVLLGFEIKFCEKESKYV